MRRSAHLASLAVLLLAPLVGERRALADWYTFVDADGVPHFTNVQPPKSKKNSWRTLYLTGPGKAGAVSGTSTAGCKVSRADVVPAHDRSPDRYVRYDAIIGQASRIWQIPEALIRAVIKVESDYDTHVVSCAGAKGLMQVMPYEEVSEKISDVFDARQNIYAGTRMLRTKANHWNTHGDPEAMIDIDGRLWPRDLVLTIASYHAGTGAVTKYRGIPPYATTQQYVRWVLKQYDKYKQRDLAKAGQAPAPTPPVETSEATGSTQGG